MRIEQALYGEHRSGHSLLATSGDHEVSAEIVQRLDLPDTAPPGVQWSPFLRGFPFQNRYVFARTFLDASASRGGMVFSHALIAPLDDIAEWQNLGSLLQYLATSDRQRPDPTTFDLVHVESQLPDTKDLMNLAEVLISSEKLPVRVGCDGFDDLVVALWARLGRGIRRNFSFRLSFGPNDLVDTPKPSLICTPQGMDARWSGYPMVRSSLLREPTSLAAAVLSGHETATPLLEFIHEIAAEPTSFDQLRQIEQAYQCSVDEPRLEHSVRAARLIEKLSPDPDSGRNWKESLVRQLCEFLRTAKAEQILLFCNLRLSSFPSPAHVWKALETWIEENTFPEEQDSAMLSILNHAITHNIAVMEWQTAILKGLTIAARSRKSGFPEAFWRWIQVGPDIVAAVFPHVPTESDVEKRLTKAPPHRLEEVCAKTLTKLALSHGWLRVHGATLSATYGPLDAVHKQIEVDRDPSFVDGLRLALRQAKPEEIVECAMKIDNPRVTSLAGEVIAKKPKLLSNVDLTGMNAQAIWREALVINPGAWQGPTDPKGTFHAILDDLLDGRSVDSSLIDHLSNSPIADLGSYPRRSEIWSRVSDIAHDNTLAATAEGWLRCAEGSGIPFKPDQDLQSAILANDTLEPTLDALISKRIGIAIQIVATLNGYDEHRFLCLLQSMISGSRSLPLRDAEEIGRLVSERRWKVVADDLSDHYRSGRRDLKPTLHTCRSLFDSWTQILLDLTPLSKKKKWEMFEDLAAELYPRGPDDEDLWQRAGGKDADLKQREDGRERWRQAVRKVRNGKGPHPTALLDRMLKDYPGNESIRYFVDKHVFGTSTDC